MAKYTNKYTYALRLKNNLFLGICVSGLIPFSAAYAQDAEKRAQGGESVVSSGGGAAALEQDIVVTATKRADTVQNIPVAITAFSGDQLKALNFRDLNSLSNAMPNVQMEDNGQTKGYANFTIRGLGLAASIPSLDPTVGVFIDGVYQGISAGLVLDNFDLEAIEVLRGPQGVLFGRNVTGGVNSP